MPVNDADARSKAKELVQRLKGARSRGMSEIDVAESSLRSFAATYASDMERELEEMRDRIRNNKWLIDSLHQQLRDYREREDKCR
jgi:hypothetical protein